MVSWKPRKFPGGWCSQQGLSAKERTSKLKAENSQLIVAENSEVVGNFVLLLN